MWLKHHDLNQVVTASWNYNHLNFSEKLELLACKLRDWNDQVFGHLQQRKKKVLARLNGVQRALCNKANPFLVNLERDLQDEFCQIMDQEELLWMQKSRVNWRDKNSKFFHMTTLFG